MSENIFISILQDCDVLLSCDSSTPHILKKEQCLVRRDIEKLLTEDIKNDFIRDLKEHCKDDDDLKNALGKMSLQKETRHDDLLQDSLFHILLNIDQINDSVLDILLEKLPYKIVDNDVVFITRALNSLSSISVNNDRLATSLIEYLDVAEFQTKIEILVYFPRIIPEKHFCNIVDKLLILMEDEENLSEQIMICLNSYNLPNEIKTHAATFIIDKILNSKRFYRIFPLLFNFLMKNSDNKTLVFHNIRLTLDKAMSDKIEDDVKFNMHNKLKSSIIENRQIYDTIVKFNAEEVLPIDFYLLVLLYMCDKSKQNQLVVTFKRQIKRNLFQTDLLEKFFDNYLVETTLLDFRKALTELAFCLIDANTTNSSVYGDMGTLIFKSIFVHPLCDTNMGRVMMFEVHSYLKTVDHKHHSLVLHMLRDLSMKQKLIDHVSKLILFLELRSLFPLRNLKTLFEIVCQNAVMAQAFVDEIQQVITKLLLWFDMDIIKGGIIGAVLLAKFLNESIEEDSPSDNIDSPLIPALDLLKYTRNICKSMPECLGLFYDELALSIGPKSHRTLLNWLNEDITDGFENDYVVTQEDVTECQLAVKGQFELNASSEVDQSLYINIGLLLQNPLMLRKITVLTPLFRLLRIVNFYLHNGNLNNIDALLGCGVLLPDIEDVEVYGEDDLKIVANAIFHTINWFREIVSAFVNQTANPLRMKVIQRVKHIVELQDKLDECMSMLNEHKLPSSYFYDEPAMPITSDRQRGPPLSKRHKSQSHTTIGTVSTSKARSWSKEKRYYTFREIDTDILKLLKYPVMSADMSASQMKSIQSKQFQFIVKDSVSKLYSIMSLRQSAQSLSRIKPETLLADCEKLIPHVHKQFRQVSHEIADCLANNDYCEDSPALFNVHLTDLKVSADLVLEFYKHIFSWSGFHQKQHQVLLKRFLKYFYSAETSANESQTQSSITPLVTTTMLLDMIKNLAKYKGQCLLLSSAGNLVKLLLALQALMIRNKKEADRYIAETGGTFIKKTWLTLNQSMEVGKSACENLDIIVEAFLHEAKILKLAEMSNTLLKETKMLQAKKDTLSSFRCIDKGTVHVIYTCILRKLVAQLLQELRHVNNYDKLKIWQATLETLECLVNMAKFLHTSTVLKVCSRHTVQIIKIFQTQGLPIVQVMLHSKSNLIQDLFGLLEIICKFLHQLCCEAVLKKDASFPNALIRSTLEQLNVKIQLTMEASTCTNVFWTGILVNKKLDGQPIVSQELTQSTVTDPDAEDSDLCQSDTDDINDGSSLQSASELFN